MEREHCSGFVPCTYREQTRVPLTRFRTVNRVRTSVQSPERFVGWLSLCPYVAAAALSKV